MRRRKTPEERLVHVSREGFVHMLCRDRIIRPASLDDVLGTHHQRPLYRHPSTGQWYTTIREERER